ncbi:MAG TPA: tetratricopeptide repeat protein [Kofleriaceae bacterium]|nr:tetratricopeptide repeat protein [Kofleriaceae bacterium]
MGWFRKSSGKAVTGAPPPIAMPPPPSPPPTDLDPQALFARARALLDAHDLPAAYAALQAAARAAPSWAAPLAWLADLTTLLAYAHGPRTDEHFAHARALAREALRLDANEDRALVVLSRIAQLRQGVNDQVPPAVHQAMLAAGPAFSAGRFDEARRLYEQIARDAPTCAEPVKRAGNCCYAARDYAGAVPWFQRAIELAPADPQTHYFLADAYFALGEHAHALRAALAAVAVNPAYLRAWRVAYAVYRTRRVPLTPLALDPQVRFVRDAAGASKIEVQPRVSGVAEASAWFLYGVHKTQNVGAPRADDRRSPFAREVDGYRAAADHALRADDATPQELASPGMAALRKLAELDRHGDLATAVLLLAFDEAYRPELETWRRAHPDGVAAFVERHRLLPL